MDLVERPITPYPSGEQMKAGDVFAGRYVLQGILGQGAMAIVHAAKDLETERSVAVKMVLGHVAGTEVNAQRFRREVEILQKLGHQGVVEVLDYSHDPEGPLYLVMERLDGETLDDVLSAGSSSRYALLTYVRALLDPLTAAHEVGVVHRDLKPANVFLRWDPDGSVKTKLIDFGIARADGGPSLTPPEGGVGTPNYMAPEQATSPEAASFASDLWSVGVLMYQIVARQYPFEGDNPYEVIVRACTHEHVPVSQLAPGTPPALEALIDECLAKDPADRPVSARALAERLDTLLADRQLKNALLATVPRREGSRKPATEGDRQDSTPPLRRPKEGPGRLGLILAVALLVAAGAGLIAFLR